MNIFISTAMCLHLYVVAMLSLTGCGQEEGTCPDTIVDQNTSPDKEDCKYQRAGSLPTPTSTATNTVTIRGSITAAFAIEVDGEEYSDAEEYYSNAISEMRTKVDAAGYKGYAVKLNAVVGFNDLTNGMTVYVQTTSERGYQGVTTVGRDNNFILELPSDAAGDYKIRANKRVTVILTATDKVPVMYCYNLSANVISVPFKVSDKPVILKSFSTSLTRYSCEATESRPTLPVPKNPQDGETVDKTENDSD